MEITDPSQLTLSRLNEHPLVAEALAKQAEAAARVREIEAERERLSEEAEAAKAACRETEAAFSLSEASEADVARAQRKAAKAAEEYAKLENASRPHRDALEILKGRVEDARTAARVEAGNALAARFKKAKAAFLESLREAEAARAEVSEVEEVLAWISATKEHRRSGLPDGKWLGGRQLSLSRRNGSETPVGRFLYENGVEA